LQRAVSNDEQKTTRRDQQRAGAGRSSAERPFTRFEDNEAYKPGPSYRHSYRDNAKENDQGVFDRGASEGS